MQLFMQLMMLSIMLIIFINLSPTIDYLPIQVWVLIIFTCSSLAIDYLPVQVWICILWHDNIILMINDIGVWIGSRNLAKLENEEMVIMCHDINGL